MSASPRGTKRTGGRTTGPRQTRGAASRAGGRGFDLQSGDGLVVVVVWGLLAVLGVGAVVGPGRAVALSTADRVTRWATHDVRDPTLDEIPVRAEGSGKGYVRATAFGEGWERRDGCSVHDLVVRRDVAGAQLHGCAVVGGTFTDPYDGSSSPYGGQALDVDHVVSLAEAWRSGAAAWKPEQRHAFANDLDVLLLVKAHENRSKGDKDPGQWQPTSAVGRCLYAQRVVAIKYRYLLTVDQRERDALVGDLATC